jgi:hypothetical protein
MKLAATIAFHNFGPFGLRDHALHLQQQRLFRRDANGMIEEHDLHAALLFTDATDPGGTVDDLRSTAKRDL